MQLSRVLSSNSFVETIENESVMKEKSNNSKKTLLLDALKDSEIRYRRLFESAKDGILILDFETGNIVDANPFIIKVIDHPLKEILGEKLWEIGLFKNKEESEQMFQELKVKGYVRFEDMPIQKQNGEITEVEFISNVYLANNKKVIQCNIRDITERKRIERILKESEKTIKNQNSIYLRLNEELESSIIRIQTINNELSVANIKAEESNKLIAAFLANMGHEIRTPLNAVLGFSDLITNHDKSNIDTERFAKIIKASGQQLLCIMDDILDISLIEAGQIKIASKLTDINTVMDEIVTTYKRVIDDKKITFLYTCKHSNDTVTIKTDGNRIKQVLCNLLNNAIKFTKEGEIEFGYTLNNDFLTFHVKDNGIGISKENQTLIFQRFRQVEVFNHNVYGGNGLGLSISKALIEKMGGTISVTSELNKGATFTFTIPNKK